MFGKLGEMFLESRRSYNLQYTVCHRLKTLLDVCVSSATLVHSLGLGPRTRT